MDSTNQLRIARLARFGSAPADLLVTGLRTTDNPLLFTCSYLLPLGGSVLVEAKRLDI